MPPIETYMEKADELSQELYNAYGAAGSAASSTPEFSSLLDKAYRLRTLSRIVQNHSENNVLTEQKVAELKVSRQDFAKAYKALWEKHAAPCA